MGVPLTPLEATVNLTPLVRTVTTTLLEATALPTPLEATADTLNLHQIVLDQQHTTTIDVATLEMDVRIFYSKEQKQHLLLLKFRTTNLLKDYKVHLITT